ncbi:DUF1993 domain-containing protein [Sphingobium fontiphilum]|nr:DUF1993 domain-containing protein [Sphingobium fontiphilum]
MSTGEEMPMALSLYTVTVPLFQQILGTMLHLLDKAEAHCAQTGVAPETIIEARLAPDMLPFSYQVKSTVVHSLGAIDGVKAGIFRPDDSTPPDSFPALRERVEGALAQLAALTPAEIDALEGGDMRFAFGEAHVDFLAENFLLSFSFPNFLFHATTAYDILRAQGVAVGKRDFLGRLAKKR